MLLFCGTEEQNRIIEPHGGALQRREERWETRTVLQGRLSSDYTVFAVSILNAVAGVGLLSSPSILQSSIFPLVPS
jgi:hypothetical protein